MLSFMYKLFNQWRQTPAPVRIPTPRTGDPTLPIDSNISPNPSTPGVEESTPPIPPIRLIPISRDSESNPVPPLPPLPISRESNESDD